MLDDLKFIHSRDAQDALGVVEKQWQQLTHQFDTSLDAIDASKITNIVYSGMGGSALPAVFVASWPGAKVSFEIVRGYQIPKYVNQNTLFIAASHSGNTEETLSALDEAEKTGAQIVVITSGGKLAERASQNNYPTFTIPTGVQPRMCSFYFIRAIAIILESSKLNQGGSVADLEQVSGWLKDQIECWKPDVAGKNNPAKSLAEEIAGKTAIVYSGPLMAPAANKFKIGINENAKNLAWVNQYPELNHNEFVGWSSHPVVKPFAVIEFRSNLEHPRVQRRFEVTQKLLSGMRPSPEVVEPKGETVLQQLLWSSVFGDFVSVYLALINNVNPTPVDLVEKFKKELN